MSISYTEERTYRKLLGPIKTRRRHVWAECVFVDPVADIAVLGSPDDQALSEEAEAYNQLVETVTPLAVSPLVVSDITGEIASTELISLSEQKFRCVVWSAHQHGPFWIRDAAQEIEAGMSGSPILAENGSAVGVFVTTSGPHPRLASHLPGWLLGALGIRLSRGKQAKLDDDAMAKIRAQVQALHGSRALEELNAGYLPVPTRNQEAEQALEAFSSASFARPRAP